MVDISDTDSHHGELIKFLELAKTHGAENVRGSIFCRMTHTEEDLAFIEKMNRGASDSCYLCGQSGHFLYMCPMRKRKGADHESEFEDDEDDQSMAGDDTKDAWLSPDDDWIPIATKRPRRN